MLVIMKIKKRKCEHCNCYFIPDRYNHHNQRYCTLPECRHASKIASRRRYRSKDKNRTPAKRQKESERVKKWQKLHHDYKKAKKKINKNLKPNFLRDIAPSENSILRDIAQLKTEVSAIPELRRNIYYYQCVTTGLAGILSGDVLRDIIGGQLDKYYDIGNRLFLSEGKNI